jgi:hypothetical protein
VGVGNCRFAHLLDITLHWCTASNPIFKRCTPKTPLPKGLFAIFCKMLVFVHLLTNEIIPLNIHLLEKLIVPHLIRTLPSLYGTCRFITGFTKARHMHLVLNQMNQNHTLPSHLCKIRLNVIFPFRPTVSSCKWSISFTFLHQNPVCVCLLLHTALPITEIPLGLLYQCRMGLLRRGCRRIEISISG